MRVLALAALAACGAPEAARPAPLAPPPAPNPRAAELDRLAAAAVAKAPLLGLAALVVHHGKVVLDKAYGYATLDRAPLATSTVFAIGSLTKQFTAAAVLQLVDAGKVKLDEPVTTYVPHLTLPVTVRQLLWQTAGLHEDLEAEVGKQSDALMDVLTGFGTEFPPGTAFRYSNSNYIALGRVVEAASGQPYADYVRDHLVKPLGLAATALCPHAHGGAQPSRIEKDALSAGELPDIAFTDAAGALCSTTADLLRWQRALFANQVVSPASLALMTLPGHTTDGASTHYGAGLITDEVAGHKRIWHNGALGFGYTSQLAYYPDDDLQIALLANTYGPRDALGKLDTRLAHAALGIPIPPLDRALAAELTGMYGPPIVTIELRVIDDELHLLIASDGEDHVLIPHGTDQLAFEDVPRFACRVVRTDGKVAALVLIVDGHEVRLDRH